MCCSIRLVWYDCNKYVSHKAVVGCEADSFFFLYLILFSTARLHSMWIQYLSLWLQYHNVRVSKFTKRNHSTGIKNEQHLHFDHLYIVITYSSMNMESNYWILVTSILVQCSNFISLIIVGWMELQKTYICSTILKRRTIFCLLHKTTVHMP